MTDLVTVAAHTPIASFTATPTTGSGPLTVDFTDTSVNSPTSWAWDFGDGATSTEQSPSHSYTTAGSYAVSLTATNSGGSNTRVRSDLVHVGTAPVTVTAGGRHVRALGLELLQLRHPGLRSSPGGRATPPISRSSASRCLHSRRPR